MSSIDIDGNDDYFEEVWTDKVIILWRDACHRPLNTQTGEEGVIDVSFSNPYLSYLFTVQTVFAFLWKEFSLLILFIL